MKVICVSGKAQHGKDTTATMLYEELTSRGYRVLLTHYADLLKWMCTNYFEWNGEKDEQGRSLLQYVGTDVVRKQEPNFWVDWVINLLKLFKNEWQFVIIADCRFPNEVDDIKANFDAVHIRVVRPDLVSPLTYEQQSHLSETALDNHPYDYIITNESLDIVARQAQTICDAIEQ